MDRTEKVDRRIKVTPAEVKERLEAADDPLTIRQLSRAFDVADETIRKKLRILRKDGDALLHNENGIFLLDTVETEIDAQEVMRYMRWLISSHSGAIICAVPIRKLIPETKRLLREKLDPEERRELARGIVRIKALLEQAEVDDELGS